MVSGSERPRHLKLLPCKHKRSINVPRVGGETGLLPAATSPTKHCQQAGCNDCLKLNEKAVPSESVRAHLQQTSDAADAAESMVQGAALVIRALEHTLQVLSGAPELGRLPDALAGSQSLARSSRALRCPGSQVSSLPAPPEPQGTGFWRPGPAEPDAAALQHRLACCLGRCLCQMAGCPVLALEQMAL